MLRVAAIFRIPDIVGDEMPDHRNATNIEISPSATALAAMHQMNDTNSRRLLVFEGGRFAGLITLTGITRFVQMKSQLAAAVPAADAAT